MPIAAKRYRPHGRHSTKQQDHTHNGYVRGYTNAWAEYAQQFIEQEVAKDPRCRICKRVPVLSQESIRRKRRRPYHCDHIVAPSSVGPVGSEAYMAAFNDPNNHQLACESCNSRKQNRE